MARYLEQRLKIRHLRAIDAIEQHKSVLRASQALMISQPALTRTLQEIEEMVGGELFVRHSRGMQVNDIGTLMTAGARKLLGTLREMEDDLGHLADRQRRVIRVGALPVAAHGLLPAVLASASGLAAQLHIELIEGRTDQLLPALAKGEIDVIVGRLYTPATPDGFVRRVLYQEPISLIARTDHPLFAMAGPAAADARAFPIVLPAVSTLMEGDVRALLDAIGLVPDDAIQSSSVGFMRELLLNGNFVTAMPRILVAGDLARDTLRILPIALPPHDRSAGLIYRDALGAMAAAVLADAPPHFSVAGHSMGARVALEMLRSVPMRIDRLALLDTGVDPQAPGEVEKRQAMLDLSAQEGMAALAARWLPPMVLPANFDSRADLRRDLFAMVERMSPAIHRAHITALLDRPDATDVLSTIACPVLIGVGDGDAWSPPERHRAIAASIPHARYVVFPDSGHMAPLEAADAVTAALAAWMAEPIANRIRFVKADAHR